MPTTDEVIFSRRSIRKYLTKPVEQNKLDKIIEAAIIAPTAANKQPWYLCIIKEPKKKLKNVVRHEWALDAPYILVIFGIKENAWIRSWDALPFHLIDATIVMDHIILAATNEGLATCWIAANDPVPIREACGLDSKYEFLALTPLGYAGEHVVKKERKTREELVKIL